MKKILFVLQKYNDPSAQNSLCIKGIINCLPPDYKIDILSLEYNHEYVEHDNIYIVRPFSKNKLLNKINYFFSFPVNIDIEKSFYTKCHELLKTQKYEYVIGIENPIESITAIAKLKKKFNFKFIVLEIDPMSNKYKKYNSLSELLWKKKATNLEKKIFNVADWIFHMASHKNHFENRIYDKFKAKSSFLDIPYIDGSLYCPIHSLEKSDKLIFLYAGAFYKKIRNPAIPMNTLCALFERTNGEAHIYTRYDYVVKLRERYGQNCHFMINDAVSNEIIKEEIKQANVLLSVGNKESDFLSSKTIQYISTGRPIVHFAFDKEDVAIPYLAKYPNSLILFCTDTIDHNVNAIIDFVNSPMINISFEDISKTYERNTFAWNAKTIVEVLNGFEK